MSKQEYSIICGDCLEVMPTLPESCVDSIVTDPPYGLSFMGKDWDHGVPGEHFWREALRVAKPGAYLLAFGGTRTFHRLAVAIEDAGWELRDTIMWVFGSGFPKSHDVSKAIGKALGAEREKVPASGGLHNNKNLNDDGWNKIGADAPEMDGPDPATDDAKQWDGWGTALKPAWEPIIVARKPLIGTVAANVLAHGTGGLNIDGCRVSTNGETVHLPQSNPLNRKGVVGEKHFVTQKSIEGMHDAQRESIERTNTLGRWPANFIHDGSEEVTGLLGEAARFFYCAKSSKKDRDEGCEGLEDQRRGAMAGNVDDGNFLTGSGNPRQSMGKNSHPTVKPTDLMRYLCRLVTPPGGIVLDPFMGSGSTGKAAVLEGFDFLGIELSQEYVDIAEARITAALEEEK